MTLHTPIAANMYAVKPAKSISKLPKILAAASINTAKRPYIPFEHFQSSVYGQNNRN